MNLLLPTYTLWKREAVRFFRQKNRVIGALLQPIIFWLLLGSGMNASFHAEKFQQTYLEYFFPGIILMIVLFTSIFSTMSIIEDRREGFLQGVLVSPTPRSAIVLGKVFGGVTISFFQVCVFLLFLLTPMVTLKLRFVSFLWLCLCIAATSFALTCIGVVIAWSMDSVQGYHAIMSVFLFPLWIFSGAAFPSDGAPFWLFLVMQANPLSYCLELIRACFYSSEYLDSIKIKWFSSYVLFFCAGCFALAVYSVRRKSTPKKSHYLATTKT